MLESGDTILDFGNDQWKGSGGQNIERKKSLFVMLYDAKDNGISKLVINDLYRSSSLPSKSRARPRLFKKRKD